MNNILFIVIILAILYYYYHQQKRQPLPINRPLTHTQETQTIPDPELTQLKSEYDAAEQELTKTKKQVKDFLKLVGYNSYQELEKGVKEMKENNILLKTKITNLQSEIRELAKRPSKPTNSKGTQKDDGELEQSLDNLIKDIQSLNNQL